MGAHGGGGGGGACQAPAGGGMGIRNGGGAWAPSKFFCREGGKPQKPLITRKKIHHIEKKVAERPSHGEKGPP